MLTALEVVSSAPANQPRSRRVVALESSVISHGLPLSRNQRRTFDLSKLTKTPIVVTSAAVDMIVNRLGPHQWSKTRGVALVSSKWVSP